MGRGRNVWPRPTPKGNRWVPIPPDRFRWAGRRMRRSPRVRAARVRMNGLAFHGLAPLREDDLFWRSTMTLFVAIPGFTLPAVDVVLGSAMPSSTHPPPRARRSSRSSPLRGAHGGPRRSLVAGARPGRRCSWCSSCSLLLPGDCGSPSGRWPVRPEPAPARSGRAARSRRLHAGEDRCPRAGCDGCRRPPAGSVDRAPSCRKRRQRPTPEA